MRDTRTNLKEWLPSLARREVAYTEACGKSIIIGEHGVVYGARAVAMPLKSLSLNLRWFTPDQPLNSFPSSIYALGKSRIDMRVGTRKIPSHVSNVVLDALKLLGIEETKSPRFSIEIESKIPVGSGLGSSASICVAVLRAIRDLYNVELNREQCVVMANSLEERFHGKPSGLDTAVVAWEEVISFDKKNGPSAIECLKPRAWPFVLVDCGVRSSTLTMIKRASPFFRGQDGDQNIGRFDQLTEQVLEALKWGRLTDLSDAMTEAQILLKHAGVVSDILDEIINFASSCNVLSAKITGAGGGGCVLMLLDPERKNDQLLKLRNRFGSKNVYDVPLEY